MVPGAEARGRIDDGSQAARQPVSAWGYQSGAESLSGLASFIAPRGRRCRHPDAISAIISAPNSRATVARAETRRARRGSRCAHQTWSDCQTNASAINATTTAIPASAARFDGPAAPKVDWRSTDASPIQVTTTSDTQTSTARYPTTAAARRARPVSRPPHATQCRAEVVCAPQLGAPDVHRWDRRCCHAPMLPPCLGLGMGGSLRGERNPKRSRSCSALPTATAVCSTSSS